MIELIYRTHFDAAHRLKHHTGACANLHGHRWEVEIIVRGVVNAKTGMIIDFDELKQTLKKLLPDHQYLNELYSEEPTAENLAYTLFHNIKHEIAGLKSLTVWESPNAGARYVAN